MSLGWLRTKVDLTLTTLLALAYFVVVYQIAASVGIWIGTIADVDCRQISRISSKSPPGIEPGTSCRQSTCCTTDLCPWPLLIQTTHLPSQWLPLVNKNQAHTCLTSLLVWLWNIWQSQTFGFSSQILFAMPGIDFPSLRQKIFPALLPEVLFNRRCQGFNLKRYACKACTQVCPLNCSLWKRSALLNSTWIKVWQRQLTATTAS